MLSSGDFLTASQAVEQIREGDRLTWYEGPIEIRGKISTVMLFDDFLQLVIEDVCHKRACEQQTTADTSELEIILNPLLKNLAFYDDDEGNVIVIERKGTKEQLYFHYRKR